MGPDGGSPGITVRRMAEEDIAPAALIDRLSFSLPWSEHAFRHEVTGNENARAWVAEQQSPASEKTIAAVLVIWLVLDEAHIGTVAVHPDQRRRGIGKLLLTHALKEAAKEGASLVYLEVRRGNLSAIQLYQQLGFQVVGERKKYYQDNGEDALLMTLPDLNSAIENDFWIH